MPEMAAAQGIATLWVKDESTRMGLGSFKALGGAFAVAQEMRGRVGDALGAPVNPHEMTADAVRRMASTMTFITASAGNHGLSVAAGARIFGAQAVVVLGSAVPEAFAARLRAIEATVDRVDGSYEDSVTHAAREAARHGWFHLADGSWEGYIDPPALVMEGYTVIADECRDAFAAENKWPTHVVLQAGVGGLAAAVAARIRDDWPVQPRIVVVEPDEAPCLMQSVAAGKMTTVKGDDSTMGRLDCKTPSLIAFEALQQDADAFVTISDTEAEQTVALIADYGFASTPSGVAGLAALRVCGDALWVDADARVLAILSEGAVD